MIRSAAVAAALLSALSVGLPFGLHPPVWVERLLFNPRERTAQGIEAYEEERYDDAVAELERARRIAGEPVPATVDFNAGTARLAAGDSSAAVSALAAAVESTVNGEVAEVDPDLAVASRYNLGNARLAAGDAAGAVEAYKRALRLAPAHADAKHNLELALRRLATSKKPRLAPPQETPGGNRPGAEERSPQGGGAEPSDERDRSGDPGGDRSGGPAPEPRGRPGEAPPPPIESPPPPLPGFEDQPDMTAAQAVALLEAVENLEREQRRADAARRARRSAAGRKDW